MIFSKHFFFFLLVTLFVLLSEREVKADYNNYSIRVQEKKILNELLDGNKYDSTITPTRWDETSNKESTLMVTVNMLVRRIENLDDSKNQFGAEITYRNVWNDPRLKFDDKKGQIRYLVLNDVQRIWTPDAFFKNEIEGHFHHLLKPNQLIRIYPNGDVLYSIRITLTLACPMNHRYYPHSQQFCSIQLASYGFTTEDLMYVWKENDPVLINTNLHLQRYTLSEYATDYCTSKTNTGTYSCLKVDFLFKSDARKFVWQLYLPSAALIIASWLSFWLHPKAAIARATLISILTLLLYFVLTDFKLPQVGYTMLINRWISACYIFIFGALVQFALVSSGQISQQSENSENAGKKDLEANGWCKRLFFKILGNANKLDMVSRVGFPLAFVLFCIHYYCKVNFNREDYWTDEMVGGNWKSYEG